VDLSVHPSDDYTLAVELLVECLAIIVEQVAAVDISEHISLDFIIGLHYLWVIMTHEPELAIYEVDFEVMDRVIANVNMSDMVGLEVLIVKVSWIKC
jgi:hypothetical protein